MINVNILNTIKTIDHAIAMGAKKYFCVSTDKAANPINLYGATKLTSDKLFIAANNYKGKHDIKFSVVRYGNVMGSRGSVIPFFMKQKENGILSIVLDGDDQSIYVVPSEVYFWGATHLFFL